MTMLKSYLSGTWVAGEAPFSTLSNPSTGEKVAECSTKGLDFGKAVRFARETGGPALRAMTFAKRGAMLAALAKAINDAREELITLAIANGGNTRGDAKFDIDGAAVTLNYYAELGAKLGEATFLVDGEGVGLGRGAKLFGQHVQVPRHGVAVHVNAFNFPAWGMAEKAAVAFLAGMPVVSKPATATGALPAGAFAFVAGAPGDLLGHLGGQDVLAFTGSSDTAASLRTMKELAKENVHLNVEADSLNAAILGLGVEAGSETLNLFVTEVAKELTQKTGQKCTAVRRIYAPAAMLDEVKGRLVEKLAEVKVGNPADDKHTMGPLATAQQLKDVRAGMARLEAAYETACGGSKPLPGLDAGCFVAPTLYVNRKPTPSTSDVVNAHEVFGPVATLMPYSTTAELLALVQAGGGGLVCSVYADDKAFLAEAVAGLAPFHGRVTIANEKVAGQTVPPGTVMPHLLHGGPGRAGGGEELGGTRGMALYLQRVALQGPRAFVESFAGVKPAGA